LTKSTKALRKNPTLRSRGESTTAEKKKIKIQTSKGYIQSYWVSHETLKKYRHTKKGYYRVLPKMGRALPPKRPPAPPKEEATYSLKKGMSYHTKITGQYRSKAEYNVKQGVDKFDRYKLMRTVDKTQREQGLTGMNLGRIEATGSFMGEDGKRHKFNISTANHAANSEQNKHLVQELFDKIKEVEARPEHYEAQGARDFRIISIRYISTQRMQTRAHRLTGFYKR
jgi:hypothetical protein